MKYLTKKTPFVWIGLFALAASVCLGLSLNSEAQAQGKPKANPNRGMPAGHPPIDQRRPNAVPQRRMRRPRTGRPLQIPGFGGRAFTPPKKPKFPRDEHGHCLGDGLNDLPKPINFVHGLVGASDKKALPPRPRPNPLKVPEGAGKLEQLKAQFVANWPIYKWQWTPSLWRYDNHDDTCDPRNEPTPLAASVFNIGLVLFLLVRFGRPKVREALVKRKQAVMSEIDKASAIKKQAKERLGEYSSQLEHLEEKRDELRAQYKVEGEHEESQMREDLSSARDRMMADAGFLVTQESKIARDKLSAQALEGALDSAESLLKSSVNGADHDRLAEEYLDQIGAALKNDGSKA